MVMIAYIRHCYVAEHQNSVSLLNVQALTNNRLSLTLSKSYPKKKESPTMEGGKVLRNMLQKCYALKTVKSIYLNNDNVCYVMVFSEKLWKL